MKKELTLTLDFDNKVKKAKVSIHEPKTNKSLYTNVDVSAESLGSVLMDGWISGWAEDQEKKRLAILEKRRAREEKNKSKAELKHDSFVEICRKADAEGISYAKYVLKYGL